MPTCSSKVYGTNDSIPKEFSMQVICMYLTCVLRSYEYIVKTPLCLGIGECTQI